jgi:hypothetical protein
MRVDAHPETPARYPEPRPARGGPARRALAGEVDAAIVPGIRLPYMTAMVDIDPPAVPAHPRRSTPAADSAAADHRADRCDRRDATRSRCRIFAEEMAAAIPIQS